MDLSRFFWPFVLLLALSALFFPFWITAVLFCLGTFFFETFYPGIIIVIGMDAIYGFETFRVGPVFGLLSIGAVLAYLLIRFLRARLVIGQI